MCKVIIIILAAMFVSGCTDAPKATAVLTAQGYKNIQITGYNFFACSKDDFYHTGFTAISPNGQSVSGTACQGLLFKGTTLRFD